MLGNEFTRLYDSLKDPKIKYTWFDFHAECKNMKWGNLSRLVHICKSEVDRYGYFMTSFQIANGICFEYNNCKNLEIMQEQTGVLRTNCMDCLDRTNVVQSVFARYISFQQLSRMEYLDIPENLEENPFEKFPDEIEKVFREAWSDNADIISQLYSGTAALKTDFTKTGNRTYQGALKDGGTAI